MRNIYVTTAGFDEAEERKYVASRKKAREGRAERLSYRDTMANDEDAHDLSQILSSSDRDFLICNSNEQIPVNSLVGKIVGLYFGGCGYFLNPCHRFTEKLVELYEQLGSTESNKFEVVYISCDTSEELFSKNFPEMPWLAIPFSDSETRERLRTLFKILGYPRLVILDSIGKVITYKGTVMVWVYGADGFPFTSEKIDFLNQRNREARQNQTLSSALACFQNLPKKKNILISNTENSVHVSELDNKILGLYFSKDLHQKCNHFNPLLVRTYNELKEEGMEFEVVLISQDITETQFSDWFQGMPWLALPFKEDNSSALKLRRYFDIPTLPGLVIIGQNGKTLVPNAVKLITDYGSKAYPFTPEKLAQAAELDKQLREAQTLQSLLVSEDLDFVVDNCGATVKVAELGEIPILLFFSAGHYCRCQKFLPKLLQTYDELKNENFEDFEVVFVSSDLDRPKFDEHFSKMPWFCLPYEDKRSTYLKGYFQIATLPTVVVIGNSGKTVTKEAADMIDEYGADAFPFDEDHVAMLGEDNEGWAKRLKTEEYHLQGQQLENDHRLLSDDKDETSSSIFLPSDYLISIYGMQVFVSELENKMVCLYFSKNSDENCQRFNPLLRKTYNELKLMGKDFEVILISQDLSETQFREGFRTMPWLALPFKHKACAKLVRCYDLRILPTLVILGPNREIVIPNAVGIIEDHGSSAYPFSSEKLTQLDKQLREAQTLKYLLGSEDKDYVMDHFGLTEEVTSLVGKSIFIFFSAEHIPQCKTFLPELIQTYDELMENDAFDVVFVSRDLDFGAFSRHFGKMTWFALPYKDKRIRFLLRWFNIRDLPRLVVIAPSGKTTSLNGVKLVREFGADGFPFTSERINFLREERKAAKQNQTLSSIFDSTDYLFSKDGNQVPVSDLENKPVGLYFSNKSDRGCHRFTPFLLGTYNKLKQDEMAFEVVLISLDESETQFREGFEAMPWLAMPFNENSSKKLRNYFRIRSLPGLVIIGTNGKTLISNAVDLIRKHGIRAYPFTREKLTELAELDKQRVEEQTLEQLLISEGDDFLMDTGRSKIQLSNVVGKHILLFFSAEHFPRNVTFLPKLIETYIELKGNEEEFEVVFVSCDSDQTKYDEHYAKMPWFALPYNDNRSRFLKRRFDIKELPRVVVIGPSGRTITTEALYLISVHGAEAFPFDEAHLLRLRKEFTTIPRGWAKKCWSEKKHEHLLVLAFKEVYECSFCSEYGLCWCYNCEVCDFYFHPRCVLKTT